MFNIQPLLFNPKLPSQAAVSICLVEKDTDPRACEDACLKGTVFFRKVPRGKFKGLGDT